MPLYQADLGLTPVKTEVKVSGWIRGKGSFDSRFLVRPASNDEAVILCSLTRGVCCLLSVFISIFVHLKSQYRQGVIVITAGSFSDVCITLPHESEQKDDTIKERA